MIALYCITATGLLLSMQHKANRKFETQGKMSLSELERHLEDESMRLDNELADLLAEHRRMCRGENA